MPLRVGKIRPLGRMDVLVAIALIRSGLVPRGTDVAEGLGLSSKFLEEFNKIVMEGAPCYAHVKTWVPNTQPDDGTVVLPMGGPL